MIPLPKILEFRVQLLGSTTNLSRPQLLMGEGVGGEITASALAQRIARRRIVDSLQRLARKFTHAGVTII